MFCFLRDRPLPRRISLNSFSKAHTCKSKNLSYKSFFAMFLGGRLNLPVLVLKTLRRSADHLQMCQRSHPVLWPMNVVFRLRRLSGEAGEAGHLLEIRQFFGCSGRRLYSLPHLTFTFLLYCTRCTVSLKSCDIICVVYIRVHCMYVLCQVCEHNPEARL